MYYILLTAFLYLIWKLKTSRNQNLEPPELSWKLPLIGHAHWLIGDSVAMYNAITKISKESLKKGGVIKLYLGTKTTYVVSDPEDCLTIMNTCLKKHYIYSFTKPLFADGLTTADAPSWKMQKKALSPAFNQHVLNGFIEIFNVQAQALVDQFASKLGKPFNHEYILRENIFNTVCLTELGVDPENFINFKKHYFPYFEEGLSIFNERCKKFWLYNEFIYNMSTLKKRAVVVADNLVKITELIIKKKIDVMKNPEYTEENKTKNFKPFLDHILDVAENTSIFTDEQIRGNTATVIAGGYDPNASALTFALTLLGSNLEVQEKARNEILQVLGSKKTNVDKEALSKLEYVEAIVKETVRMYPSLPIIARQLDQDIKLKNCTLKTNSDIMIAIIGANYHEMWGPEADVFRPERWLEKYTLPKNEYFATFGFGRRKCVGKLYTYMLLKITIAKLLLNYRISSDISNMVIKMDTTIKPASGHMITLEERKIAN